jgi:predicted nucleic acid-binding protein
VTRIFWDTNLFIYLFEENPEFTPRVLDIRQAMLSRGDRLYTSSLTFGEVLVKPTEKANHQLLGRYRALFQSSAITVIAFDAAAVALYAGIRSDRGIARPDAIQLACAANAEIDLFITNDDRLSQKQVPGVKFVTSLHRAPI